MTRAEAYKAYDEAVKAAMPAYKRVVFQSEGDDELILSAFVNFRLAVLPAANAWRQAR